MRDFDPLTNTSPYILAESGSLPEYKNGQISYHKCTKFHPKSWKMLCYVTND